MHHDLIRACIRRDASAAHDLVKTSLLEAAEVLAELFQRNDAIQDIPSTEFLKTRPWKVRKMATTMGTTLGKTSLTRRYFITILGGSAALAGLSACALGSTDKAASPTIGPAKLDVEQTIEVWDYDPTGVDVWVAADKSFGAYFKEKYPKITVKRSQAGFAGFAEGLLTSVAGGAKYDVIYGWAPWLPQFRKNNVVSALDPFLKNDGTLSADSFHDYGKDVADGKTYGLAWYASADFLFYNKTALAAAGLDDPAKLDAAGQWTYDAFQKLAKGATTTRHETDLRLRHGYHPRLRRLQRVLPGLGLRPVGQGLHQEPSRLARKRQTVGLDPRLLPTEDDAAAIRGKRAGRSSRLR